MLCCVCLLETINTIGISEEEGKQLRIAEIVSKYLWFKLEDILRGHICTNCWSKIDDFNVFYKTIEKAHQEFQNVQQDLDQIEDENKLNINAIKQEEIQEDNYVVVIGEQQFDVASDNDDSNSTRNPLDESELSRNIEDQSSDGESNNSFTLNKTKSNENMHINSKDSKSSINTKIYKNNNLATKSENNIKPKRKIAIFNDLVPQHTEEMIQKHIPMGCNLCVFVGKTFSDIVAHFKAEHPNTRAYVTCCDKTFNTRFYLGQHAMTHENPNCFSCLLCNKSFTTTGGLKKHNLRFHASDEELTLACDSCPRRFAKQYLLERHKTSHIPRHEWKFFCTKCPKSKAYASAYLLNIHDYKTHKTERHICNVCAKEIRSKKFFEKHVKEHYEGSGPRLKCPLPNCDTWLKDEHYLKIHLRRHNTHSDSYKCPVCDKVLRNRRALIRHRDFVHSEGNFKCKCCHKSFKRALSLKEHMTRHTGEVLYNCPFCPKTCNSHSNMHLHKKKKHPIEWEALRRQKMANNSNETLKQENQGLSSN